MGAAPILLVALVTSLASAGPQRITIAVVRTDHRLVPFAAWDGDKWRPAGLTDAPRVFWVWPAAGGGPIRARVRGVEIVEAHCETQVVLKTGLPEPKPDPESGVEGRFGVAVDDAAVRVSAVERLSRSHALWRKAEQVVRAGFDAREKAQAEATQHALPRYEPTPAVRLLMLYCQAGAPRSPLYFEAERAYPTGPFFADPACPSRTVMAGWLSHAGDGIPSLVGQRVLVTDCDGKELRTASPLGALRVGSRSFWILQDHGYEDEAYQIVEIGPTGAQIVFEADGGGC
jgi:hypothetical protein